MQEAEQRTGKASKENGSGGRRPEENEVGDRDTGPLKTLETTLSVQGMGRCERSGRSSQKHQPSPKGWTRNSRGRAEGVTAAH